jgi:hypothetical protein
METWRSNVVPLPGSRAPRPVFPGALDWAAPENADLVWRCNCPSQADPEFWKGATFEHCFTCDMARPPLCESLMTDGRIADRREIRLDKYCRAAEFDGVPFEYNPFERGRL